MPQSSNLKIVNALEDIEEKNEQIHEHWKRIYEYHKFVEQKKQQQSQ